MMDTGLTLSIFMIWSNLFPNASAWEKAYSHVYPMHSGERYRIHGPLVSDFHEIISKNVLLYTVDPLYNDTLYNSKPLYNVS